MNEMKFFDTFNSAIYVVKDYQIRQIKLSLLN